MTHAIDLLKKEKERLEILQKSEKLQNYKAGYQKNINKLEKAIAYLELIGTETLDELFNIGQELVSQDNRGTAMPYFYQVQTEEITAAPEGQGEKGWHYDGDVITDEEGVKAAIYEYSGGEFQSSVDFESHYEELSTREKDELMIKIGYSEMSWHKVHKRTNAFFTEKGIKNHIEKNRHRYGSNTNTYLDYAFRNPEMEIIQKFLCKLAGGEIKK